MDSLYRLFSENDAEDMRRSVRRRLNCDLERQFSHIGDNEIDIRETSQSIDTLLGNLENSESSLPELHASNSISIGNSESSLPELHASNSTSIGEIANIEECNLPIAFFPPNEFPIDTYANLPIATKIKIVILHRINN
jgi:hypothetical protein